MYKYLALIVILFPFVGFANTISLPFTWSIASPADGTQYVSQLVGTVGASTNGTWHSCNSGANIKFISSPVTGTITSIKIYYTYGVIPTAENNGYYFCRNGVLIQDISASSSPMTSSQRAGQFIFNNLSIPVSLGDFLDLEWQTPGWSTNPTTFTAYATFDIEYTASSSTTVTDDYSQSQINLLGSLFLFLTGFFGVIWLIRKH